MLKTVKKGWAEFREFAFKGNMIDLAIAVVIGTAFSGVIGSLVKDIIMPAVSYVTTATEVAKKKVAEVAVESIAKIAPSTTQASTQPTSQPSTQPTTAVTVATPPVPLEVQDPKEAAMIKKLVEAIEASKPPAPPPPAVADKVQIDWKIGRIEIGHFIAELLNFMIIAFAVFLIMVKVLGSVMKRVSKPVGPSEPTTRECPYCLSNIPIKATKCAHCTSEMPKA